MILAIDLMMNINITDILFVLIIFQLLFLSFFLFTQQKGKQISNRLLGFFFLSICVNLLDVFILKTGFYFSYPWLAGLGSCLPLLFGPLLYFYTQSVIYKKFPVTIKYLKHFLPFLVIFFGTEFYYLIQSRDTQERILRSLSEHHIPFAISLVSTLIFVQFLLYAIASLRLVALYKKATNQLFSNPKSTDVSWLYSTLIFFITIMVITTLNGLLTQTPLAKYYLIAFNMLILAVLVFVIMVLMKALRNLHFFAFAEDRDVTGRGAPQVKYASAGAEHAEKEKLVQNALQFMESNRPYLDPELSLEQFAGQLSVKPRALSQAINEILQQNFFDFINRYRIDEAKRLLTNPEDEKITVLEILYEVGFNSKSSFNTLFKKYTGLTPTEFRQQQAS